MARALGPDPVSSNLLTPFPGRTVTVYSDEACTTLASIAAYVPATPGVVGATIADSKVRNADDGEFPQFWFPDGVRTLWGKLSRSGQTFELGVDPTAFTVAQASDPLRVPPRGRAWPASTPTLLAVKADSTMQTGHNWTATNNTAGDLNYTVDYGIGTQCLKMTTGGAAAQTTITLPRQTAINMTGKAFRLLIKLDSATFSHLNYVKILIGSGASQFESFWQGTVCQYADDPASYIKSGEWTWLTLLPQLGWTQTGTPDITAIRDIRLTVVDDAVAPTTVLVGGLQILPMDNTTYPNGVFSLTFDDGYASQLLARQHMDKYGYPGTAYIIRDRVDTGVQWLSKAQLTSLQRLSGWEISAHCDTAANHAPQWGFQTSGLGVLTPDILAMRRWLQDNDFRGGYGMALPKGGWDATLMPELRKQFSYVRGVTSTGRMYGETHPPMDQWKLRGYLPANDTAVTPNSTRNTLQWMVDQTAASKGWTILGFHNMVTSAPAISTDYPMANFTALVDYIAASGAAVRTVGDVLGIAT